MATNFEDFWQKYQGNLPGYADSGAIQEIVREIAYAAWQEASGVTTRRMGKVHPYAGTFPSSPDQQSGLNLREYFAAQALQGLLANPKLQTTAIALDEEISLHADFAKEAVELADALIKALNQN